jgi:hypothetical protein
MQQPTTTTGTTPRREQTTMDGWLGFFEAPGCTPKRPAPGAIFVVTAI